MYGILKETQLSIQISCDDVEIIHQYINYCREHQTKSSAELYELSSLFLKNPAFLLYLLPIAKQYTKFITKTKEI